MLDAHPPKPEPIRNSGDPFRDFLASIRSDGRSQGRVAHRVLLIGFGATPCKEGVAALCKLGLLWIAEKWCTMYSEFSGDDSVKLADLLPGPETKPGKVMPKIPQPVGRKFIGVYPDNTAWMATIGVGGKVKYLGRYLNPFDAAIAYDTAARVNPLPNGKPRKLNFTVPPEAFTPEPVTRHSLERAA